MANLRRRECMDRGAWPEGVELRHNPRVSSPPWPPNRGGKLAPPVIGWLGGPLFDKIAR